MRPSKMAVVKKVAETFAELSTCSSRAAVGAVLFDADYRIVATGYNGTPQHMPHCDTVGCRLDAAGSCVAAVHAEMNAIFQCAAYGIPTKGLRLYTTHAPCDRCSTAIVRAGITMVIYGVDYHRETGTRELFRKAGVQYWPYTEPGQIVRMEE